MTGTSVANAPTTWTRYWPAGLVATVLLLLPFGRWAGLPVLAMSVLGAVQGIRHRRALWQDPRVRLLGLLWLGYAVPMVIGSLDAVAPSKSWTTTIASLRFLLMGIFFIHCLGSSEQRRMVWRLSVWILLFWAVDALVQSAVGFNLVGMPLSEDRLNGIFGPTNIKLGHVLAALSPLALEYARRFWSRPALIAVFGLLLAVILLAGTRAAWVMFLLVTVCYLYLYARTHRGRWYRSLAWIAGLLISVGILGYQLSPGFQERVDRSLLLLEGDRQSVDLALSRRLPIWDTALSMAAEHPVNGVGPRGFRYAYIDHAQPADPWLNPRTGTGASHAHQLALEVLTETGIIGLIGVIVCAVVGFRHWRGWTPAARRGALPFAIALAAMLFPLNTHLAFYSTFWGLLFWWLVSGYCAFAVDE